MSTVAQRMSAYAGVEENDGECAACEAGVTRLDSEMERLLEDLFPLTAEEDVLDSWDALCRPQTALTNLETRQAMLAARMAAGPEDFVPGGLDGELLAAGVIGRVLEADGGLQVQLGRSLGLGEAERDRELDEILPAHLGWTVTQSMDWLTLDAWAPAWERLDERRLKWSQIDSLTAANLAEYEENETADA